MRASALAFVAAVLSLAALARAGDPCPWQDPGRGPRLFLDDRVAIFRAYYVPAWAACVARAAGKAEGGARDVQVEWLAGADPGATVIRTEKVELRAGPGDAPARVEGRLFPGQVCEGRRPEDPSRRLALVGPPGKEEVAELVPLRVHLKASQGLAPLEYTSPPLDFPCAACPGLRQGSGEVREAENGRDLVLEITADRAWFECARTGATLSLLGFAGDSQRDVLDAIQPDLVLPDLEKEVARKADQYVLRKVLPMARLCARKRRFWAFELWGRGELKALGGGGREVHDAKCP